MAGRLTRRTASHSGGRRTLATAFAAAMISSGTNAVRAEEGLSTPFAELEIIT